MRRSREQGTCTFALVCFFALGTGTVRAAEWFGPTPAAVETIVRHVDFSTRIAEPHLVPGLPAIPATTLKIVLPYGRDIASAEFLPSAGHAIYSTTYPTTPYPRPMCGGAREEVPAPRYFTTTEAYPVSPLGSVDVVTKHGYRIAYVTVFPIRYFPATGAAMAHDGGELRLSLRATDPSPLFRGLADDRDEALLLSDHTTDDLDALATYPEATRTERDVDYLVLAPKAFIDDNHEHSLSALLAEKEARLLRTSAVALETIAERGPGRDLPEKVRNAIVEGYRGGIRFVLLVGNGYKSAPTRQLKVDLKEGILPSDLYFACLDGDFDANRNSVFGETRDGLNGGDIDMACEIAVGRAPVTTLADMHAFVRKTLRFASLPSSDPRVRQALFFGEKLDGSTLGISALRQLTKGGSAGGVPTTGYPAKTIGTELAESFSKEYTAAQVIQALNEGGYYTVNHLGHALQKYCMRFNSSAIAQLRNELPFFGITQGCHPGDLRGPNWASAMVVAENGGAAAMIANSNYGYYQPNGIDGPSNRLHLLFWDTVFSEFQRYLGRAHYRAKERLIPQAKASPYLRWILYESNLLGDPELVLNL